MVRGLILLLLLFVLSVFYLDAFLLDQTPTTRVLYRRGRSSSTGWHQPFLVLFQRNDDIRRSEDLTSSPSSSQEKLFFTHADIVWKVRPPPETSLLNRLWLRLAANLIRLDCKIFQKEPPVVLCPKGGQAVLEAYVYSDMEKNLVKVGRFGFTTERGPPAPQIQDTVEELYTISTLVGVGAIIYMFVEPQYRKRNIGVLALEVIALIHAIQGIDFTVLVVDDDGSGKLIDWYLQHGYAKAPKLQDILGSPNAKHGITMISPTCRILPHDCQIQWW